MWDEKCLQGGLTYRYRELLGSDDRVRGVLVEWIFLKRVEQLFARSCRRVECLSEQPG